MIHHDGAYYRSLPKNDVFNPLPMSWQVYIVRTEAGKLYTGISNRLEQRLQQHRTSPRGAKFFRISKPSQLLWRESVPTRSAALKREWQIKRLKRAEKLALIAGENNR